MTQVYQALLLILISSIYCDICDNVRPQNKLESQLVLFLKKWRVDRVDTGIFILPSLKVLKIPDVKHTYDRKGITMTFQLSKIQLTDLDRFSIKDLNVLETNNSLELSISLNLPKLTLYADNYKLHGRAYLMYPLKGAGNMTVIFRNNNLFFKIRFLSTGDGISTRLENFRFDFNVNSLEANLVDSSWPINKVLNSDGVEILASYHDDILEAMWYYVVPYVNRHLVNVTIAQIVGKILNTKL